MKTVVRRAVSRRYTVTQNRVSKAFRVGQRRSNNFVVSALLLYQGRRLNLKAFSTGRRTVRTRRGKRVQATVKVLRSGRKSPVDGTYGGFHATGRNNNELILERTGVVRSAPRYAGDEKLRSLTGPAIAQMVRSAQVLDQVNQLMEEVYPTEFFRQLRLGQRQSGRR